jgi:hypothetical protein
MRKELSAGKHHSERAKVKMRLAQLGPKNHMYGKHHTQETKEKLSTSLKGRHLSEETKKHMSEAQRGNKKRLGKVHSVETKRKMSEIHKGKPWSQLRRDLHQQKKQLEIKMRDKNYAI